MHRVLHIRLLGGFHLQYGDVPLTTVNSARLQGLLAYLVVHSDTLQLRQHVAFQLWPDSPESQARNNLRQLLFQLRTALPEAERVLTADGATVGWRRDDQQVIDVDVFQSALNLARIAEQKSDSQTARYWLEQALSTYQGELLPSCYEEWILPEREQLHATYLTAHRRLVRVLEQMHDYEAALQTAQALLRQDALDEQTYLLLIRLHTYLQDRLGAHRVFQSAVEIFRRELDSEPSEVLLQAYDRSQRVVASQDRGHRADDNVGATPPLVGRQAERKQAQETWERAEQGEAVMLLVTGEAGIGKTRLAEELFIWAHQRGATVAATRSYAVEGRLSFAPVTEWLRSPALRPHIGVIDPMWLNEVARLLPELLIDHPTLLRPLPISEYGQRQRFFEALARAVLAAPHPLLLWVDDLQWCDPETLEWLHYLLRFKPRESLLVLGTARSEESPPDHPLSALVRQLRIEDRLASIELSPLDAAETARLAAQVQGHELEPELTLRLFRETEGYPLFVVETMRAGMTGATDVNTGSQPEINGGDHSMPPPRVMEVLARRLSQLSPAARKVAEVAAALGRAFTWELLARTSHEDEDSLIQSLDELWHKRIVREQAANLYDFTHDKIREVAYAEISAPQRRLLHRRIAQTLEALHADNLDPVCAQIAAHLEQGGLLERAIPYYRRAGMSAADVYANEDAINLLTRGLNLLLELPPSSQRDKTERALQTVLVGLYRATQGWTAPEVVQRVHRILVLSEKSGDIAERAQALYGVQSVYVVLAQLDRVESTYGEMQRLFSETKEGRPPLFAGSMRAVARLHMGFLREGHEMLEEIVSARDVNQAGDLQASQGVNYLALGHGSNAHALWCLGYPAAALKQADLAVYLTQQFTQPFNQALAATYRALLMELMSDVAEFQMHAEHALALSHEYRAPYYRAWSRILVSFALAWQRPEESSLTELNDAIRAFTDNGARLRLPYYLSLLARAYLQAGRFGSGLGAIEDALGESRNSNERWWDAELHRLRGELMLARGADGNDVEAAYRRALDIARGQDARSLELRAATSLARLWQSQNRRSDAYNLLSPLYAAYPREVLTPDLRAAQALLETQ